MTYQMDQLDDRCSGLAVADTDSILESSSMSVVSDSHAEQPSSVPTSQVVLSFDIEEHHRIEAAVHLSLDTGLKTHYSTRMESVTRRLLDNLARREITATFFIVSEIGRDNPMLIRDIHEAGHEVASHSWDHRRIHHFTPKSFAEDLKRSKDTLEQITGEPVTGFRAPTFSLVRQTRWAIDVLVEQGFLYDSSIFPVRHDRYGVASAPRVPFLLQGREHSIIELPPATLRLLGMNLPVGGGGYFRLFPLFLLRWALRQLHGKPFPSTPTLYFHPWEFDPDQARLPLSKLSSWRTYVGLSGSTNKLEKLLATNCFTRAVDVAHHIESQQQQLPTFAIPEQ